MILMLNRPEFVEATLAANQLGAIAVPVNFRLTPPELAFLVQDCEAAVVVTETVLADVAKAVRDLAPALTTVIVAGGGDRRRGARLRGPHRRRGRSARAR